MSKRRPDAGSTYLRGVYTTRAWISERRFVTLGLLAGQPVSIVHTETEHEIRVISFRKATRREAKIYFDEIQN